MSEEIFLRIGVFVGMISMALFCGAAAYFGEKKGDVWGYAFLALSFLSLVGSVILAFLLASVVYGHGVPR